MSTAGSKDVCSTTLLSGSVFSLRPFSAPALGQTTVQTDFEWSPYLLIALCTINGLCQEQSRSRQIYSVLWLFQGVTVNTELHTVSENLSFFNKIFELPLILRDKIKALVKLSKCLSASLKTDELKKILKCLTELQQPWMAVFTTPIN